MRDKFPPHSARTARATGPRRAPAAAARGAHSRVLRIIGGAWRGRRLRFPAHSGIRPTPDRVRETLFNWIGPRVAGRQVLDLFAGSGALGLEALSRGAAGAQFIERDAPSARALAQLLEAWAAVGAQVACTDALRFLAGAPRAFDLVFLDPPFEGGYLAAAAERLAEAGWLAPGALIYVECPAREALPVLPAGWQLLRAKRAGEVGYHLLEHSQAPSGP
ncbi:MAG TPA: 16S rRNA (guanine(966)-N(2))-methyltransferase RsmD [Steroidobacteraceae bacterium]|nr:16S rRNA (guanine(966)-N(2))-methyltransferase RsmD [Steroidobacteraceae bacterium]